MKKCSESLREHTKNIIDLDKKKKVTANKTRTKITLACKSVLHLWEKNLKKSL